MAAGAVAFVLLTSAAAASPSDTRSQIADAKRRLSELQSSIAAQRTQIASMQRAMHTLAEEVAGSRRSYELIRARLTATEALIAENQERYDALRAHLDEAVAQTYRRGRSFALNALLGTDSFSDAADVFSYSNAIARRTAELAEEARAVGARLDGQRQREADLKAQSETALARLSSRQAALARTFADSQDRLADLARSRTELGALLVRLRAQLRAEELAAALAAANGGTPLSFGRWAEVFLSYMHAPVARNNLIVMVAWQMAEWTDARWNPLATTQPMPGSTAFNSSRVQNYVSLRQGLEATARTLRHTGYGYEKILAGLARNADPMTTARAINESRWCRGCAGGQYVIELIEAVERYYDRYASKRA